MYIYSELPYICPHTIKICLLESQNLENLEEQYKDLSILHRIAIQLNGAVSLTDTMKLILKETVELLEMQTGWIWLLHPESNSVFLAASYNLPPAFTQNPERLSGWCYCIDTYLANQLPSAANISEITCSRLKDLKEGTNGLRFHATVPLFDGENKMGLLNVVSDAKGQINERQLALLHSIGEMLGVAVKRTRIFEKSKAAGVIEERQRLAEHFQNNLIKQTSTLLSKMKAYLPNPTHGLAAEQLIELQHLADAIHQLSQENLSHLNVEGVLQKAERPLQYPISPLSKRELEVLEQLKLGKTNKAIAEELFITERTVKFHVSTLLNKLDAKNRTDAVQVALKRGIVNL